MMRFSHLRRPALGQLAWLMLFSGYIALALNLYFYQQAFALLPVNSLHNALVFATLPLVAFCVINILLTLASCAWLEKPLAALLILASAAAQYFMMAFHVVIDRGMIDNILDTTPAETLALLSPRLIATLLLSGLLPAVLAWWLRSKGPRLTLRSALWRAGSIVVSGLLIALVALLFYKDYASLFRNNKELIKSLNPSNSIAAVNSWYVHNRLDNLPLVRIGTDAKQLPQMASGPRHNLTIVVLGETSRAENFSLGGYGRDTNPLLAKDDVVYYPKATSCGTSTAVSVPCMFSNMPRAHYSAELAHHQEGVLDIIQRAGIQVLWNENDGGCKGACDRVPHQDMTRLDLPGQCIDGECDDAVLFHGLEAYIDGLKGDGIIVLHTIGSHGPTYYHRYTASLRTFTPTCDSNEIQSCSQQELINTYDNTIVNVDNIVDRAIKLLETKRDRFTTSLVYLSDHGESLGENGVYLHGLPWSIAPEQQKHVPMLVWLSDDYRKRYRIDYRCLKTQAQNNAVSQDNLFSTLLGLTGVSTREYHPQDDLLTPCRGGV